MNSYWVTLNSIWLENYEKKFLRALSVFPTFHPWTSNLKRRRQILLWMHHFKMTLFFLSTFIFFRPTRRKSSLLCNVWKILACFQTRRQWAARLSILSSMQASCVHLKLRSVLPSYNDNTHAHEQWPPEGETETQWRHVKNILTVQAVRCHKMWVEIYRKRYIAEHAYPWIGVLVSDKVNVFSCR